MKNSLYTLVIVCLLTSSLHAGKGGYFGAAFGGSLLGSMAGNAMSQPRQTVVVDREPVYYNERNRENSLTREELEIKRRELELKERELRLREREQRRNNNSTAIDTTDNLDEDTSLNS